VHHPAGLFASHVNQVRDASTYLDEVVRNQLAGVDLSVSTHVRSGGVVEAILAELDGDSSSVIVMATRGYGGLTRAVLGSVASELLSKSPVPVVVVRAEAHPVDDLRHILVPIDGSPESEQSLTSAADVATIAGAKVTVLQVVTPSRIPTWGLERAASLELGQYVDPVNIDRAALADARQYVNTLAGRLETRGISAEGLAMLGEVPGSITETADALGTDLIVMRTRGHTGAARAVLGSVADAVVRSAGVPVMLQRPDEALERQAAAAQTHALAGVRVW
jgi:nucleotide-binding universal stress UspA family protein